MKNELAAKVSIAAAVLCLTLAGQAQTPAYSVQDIQISQTGDITRIAIETTGSVEFQSNRLSNPERVYFDLLDTETRPRRPIEVSNSVVERVRVARTQQTVTRVVIDLGGSAEFTTTRLSDPERLVIEVRGQAAAPEAASANSVEASAANSFEATGANSVEDVQISEVGEVTRIVIQTTGPVEFQSSRLASPERVYFDLLNTQPARTQTIEAAGTVVRRVRVAPTQPTVTRVVVDLAGPAEFSTSRLTDPDRLVIEIQGEANGPGQPAIISLSDPTPPKIVLPAPDPIVPTPAASTPAADPVQEAAPIEVAPAPPQRQTVFAADGTLRYGIHWPTGVKYGEVLFETRAGGAAIEFRFDASLPGVPVEGEIQSRLDPEGCTQEFSKRYVFGFRKAEETTTNAEGVVTRGAGGAGATSIAAPEACMRDALAFVNFLRKELAAGRQPNGGRILFGAQYELRLTHLDSGEDLDRVEVSVKGPASSHTFEIDFRRDPLRTPVRVRVPMPLGQFVLELVE